MKQIPNMEASLLGLCEYGPDKAAASTDLPTCTSCHEPMAGVCAKCAGIWGVGDYADMPLLEQLHALAGDLAPGPDEIVLAAVARIEALVAALVLHRCNGSEMSVGQCIERKICGCSNGLLLKESGT